MSIIGQQIAKSGFGYGWHHQGNNILLYKSGGSGPYLYTKLLPDEWDNNTIMNLAGQLNRHNNRALPDTIETLMQASDYELDLYLLMAKLGERRENV